MNSFPFRVRGFQHLLLWLRHSWCNCHQEENASTQSCHRCPPTRKYDAGYQEGKERTISKNIQFQFPRFVGNGSHTHREFVDNIPADFLSDKAFDASRFHDLRKLCWVPKGVRKPELKHRRWKGNRPQEGTTTKTFTSLQSIPNSFWKNLCPYMNWRMKDSPLGIFPSCESTMIEFRLESGTQRYGIISPFPPSILQQAGSVLGEPNA